ncbi:MAG: PAS domain S-box protein, partial [Thermoplasmatota archaeon]
MDVLLVDDEPGMLEQTKIYLEKENEDLDIDSVSTVDDAIAKLDEHDYDAIVSDYMMPDKDGLELLKILRRDQYNDIPFIIFTGRGGEDAAIEALNLGANHYIRKRGDPRSQYKDLARAVTQEVEHQRKYKKKEKVKENLTSLMDGSGDYIHVVDEECNILFANKAKLDHHDLTQSEITECNYRDLHQEENPELFEKKVKKVFETGEPQTHEFKNKADKRYSTSDKRYSTRTLSPLNDPKTGEVEAVSVISKDIPESKEGEEKYKVLFQQLTDSLFLEDTEGNILDVNDAACDLLGYEYQELVGMNVGELVPEEEPAFLPDEIDEAAKKGKPLETKNKRKDGSIVPVELRGRIIEIGDEKRMLVSIRDISERKKAENKILEEKEKIENLHDVANEFENCKSEEKVYDLIIDASENILGFDKLCSVEIIDSEEVYLMDVSQDEERGYEYQPLSESGYVKKTYENKRSYIIDDSLKNSDAEPVKEKYRSVISIP